ncbi:MAG: SDR family NAD(P)-dependent oxidoreductase [Acidithiobacillus sp.]|nr:SDR family NAD(P)-dependent oxidoreductase [Acidithiobacillus sp.]
MQQTAVVTGASSGIGKATVQVLLAQGYRVFFGARRLDRLQQIAQQLGGTPLPLDVTSSQSVAEFARQIPGPIHVLVNNAGGALGKEPLVEFVEEHWLQMYQSNVLGLARVTRALWPQIAQADLATVINIGSVAGEETYPGGAGYTSCKHAVRALSETMRLEWLGKPIRVTEIDPGLVETEFSIVRFAGDQQAAKEVYQGMTPLLAEDIAEAIRWVLSLPGHVNIDRLVIKPREQARVDKVYRRS